VAHLTVTRQPAANAHGNMMREATGWSSVKKSEAIDFESETSGWK
jgi:hypothetical protein